MSASEDFRDVLIAHGIYLEFYKNKLERDLRAKIKNLEKELLGDINKYYSGRNNLKPKTNLNNDLKKTLVSFEEESTNIILTELEALAVEELGFYEDNVNDIFDGTGLEVNSLDNPRKEIEESKTVFSDGKIYTLLAFLRRYFKDNASRIKQQVDSSIFLGQDEEELDTAIAGYTGQTQVSAIRVGAMVGTLVTFVSSTIGRRFFESNSDKISGYQWQSVIDSRTSSFCRWADGKVWYYETQEGDLGGPYTPPVHERCRSEIVPIFKSWGDMGLDDQYSDTFPGNPPKRTTYYEWLGRQPATVQREVLGTVRYDLWKKEGVAPSRFYNQQGKYLTLDELKQKNIEIPKKYNRYVR